MPPHTRPMVILLAVIGALLVMLCLYLILIYPGVRRELRAHEEVLGLDSRLERIVAVLFLSWEACVTHRKATRTRIANRILVRTLNPKRQACAKCGTEVIPGLRDHVDAWSGPSPRDDGKAYAGSCSSCRRYYCWECVKERAEAIRRQAEVRARAEFGSGVFGSVVVLDEEGMMHCPRCGKLERPRTCEAT